MSLKALFQSLSYPLVRAEPLVFSSCTSFEWQSNELQSTYDPEINPPSPPICSLNAEYVSLLWGAGADFPRTPLPMQIFFCSWRRL